MALYIGGMKVAGNGGGTGIEFLTEDDYMWRKASGQIVPGMFYATPCSRDYRKDLSLASVSAEPSAYSVICSDTWNYDLRPSVSVVLDGMFLLSGTDFSVRYEDLSGSVSETDVRIGKVIAEGLCCRSGYDLSGYKGSLSLFVPISYKKQIELTDTNVTISPVSTEFQGQSGTEWRANVNSVSCEGHSLISGEDYYIESYQNNSGFITADKTEIASALISGLGTYSGSVTKEVSAVLSVIQPEHMLELPFQVSANGTWEGILPAGTYALSAIGHGGSSWAYSKYMNGTNKARGGGGGGGGYGNFTLDENKLIKIEITNTVTIIKIDENNTVSAYSGTNATKDVTSTGRSAQTIGDIFKNILCYKGGAGENITNTAGQSVTAGGGAYGHNRAQTYLSNIGCGSQAKAWFTNTGVGVKENTETGGGHPSYVQIITAND